MSEVGTPLQGAPAPRSTSSKLMRGAIWVAIGALIAAAFVCVFWVIFGDQNGIIARAFLTIVLLAGFAGMALVDSSMASRRPEWLVLASMITWVVVLLVGAVKIWLLPVAGEGSFYVAERLLHLLFVAGVMQLLLLHLRLYLAAAARHVTVFSRVITYATLAFLIGLAGMLVFWLTFPHHFDYPDLYWKIVVALTILVAVGTMLIPLLNALFAPKKPRPAMHMPPIAAYPPPQGVGLRPWPTFADGVTPLPMLPDGSPDFNAYHYAPPAFPVPPAGVAPVLPPLPTIVSAPEPPTSEDAPPAEAFPPPPPPVSPR